MISSVFIPTVCSYIMILTVYVMISSSFISTVCSYIMIFTMQVMISSSFISIVWSYIKILTVYVMISSSFIPIMLGFLQYTLWLAAALFLQCVLIYFNNICYGQHSLYFYSVLLSYDFYSICYDQHQLYSTMCFQIRILTVQVMISSSFIPTVCS